MTINTEATTKAGLDHTESKPKTQKGPRIRKRKGIITGEVVPVGALGSNPNNPYSNLTPEQRWDEIFATCVNIFSNAMARHRHELREPNSR